MCRPLLHQSWCQLFTFQQNVCRNFQILGSGGHAVFIMAWTLSEMAGPHSAAPGPVFTFASASCQACSLTCPMAAWEDKPPRNSIRLAVCRSAFAFQNTLSASGDGLVGRSPRWVDPSPREEWNVTANPWSMFGAWCDFLPPPNGVTETCWQAVRGGSTPGGGKQVPRPHAAVSSPSRAG